MADNFEHGVAVSPCTAALLFGSRPRSIDVESITQPLDDLLELDLRVLDLALNGDLAPARTNFYNRSECKHRLNVTERRSLPLQYPSIP